MDTLKKVLAALFNNWWIYLTLYGICAWAAIILTVVQVFNPNMNDVRMQLMIAPVVLLACSLVWQVANRRWLISVLHAGLVAFSGLYMLYFQFTFSDLRKVTNTTYDYDIPEPEYSLEVEIPDTVVVHEPVLTDNGTIDSIVYAVERTEPDLIIYQDFEPGLYKYDYFAGKTEQGTLYLKAFEVTQETPISAEDMETQTKAYAYNWSKKIVPITSSSSFTINEKNNGNAFATRFEVWLKPHDGKEERKLFEKIYRIRGWADL